MAGVILVDTSVWVAYFCDVAPTAHTLETLLSERGVVTCPPVLAELAIGLPADRHDAVIQPLAELPSVGLPQCAWLEAAAAGRDLRARGLAVPLIDLLVATAAVRSGAELWTLDADFQRVSEVMPRLRLVSS